MLKILAIAILAPLAFAAEEAKEAKPNPAIDKAIAPAMAEATKGYGVYQEALAKASDKAVKELEKLKAEAMKRGDLSLAVAVDAQIKDLKEGALGDKVIAKTIEKNILLGDMSFKKLIKANEITERTPGSMYSEAVEAGAYRYLLWNGNQGPNYFELSAQLPKGKYYFYALMTSAGNRMCKILVNKKEIGTGFGINTGGWSVATLKTDKVGPFAGEGLTTIRIESANCPPHFYGFAISPDKSLTLKAEDFEKEGTK